MRVAIQRFSCRSQVRKKEERYTEGVQIPPFVKKKRRQKPTMNDHNTKPYRLGRRPGKQDPRPLPSNQGRVEKLATGQTSNTTHKLKLVKNTLTVGSRKIRAAQKRNETFPIRHHWYIRSPMDRKRRNAKWRFRLVRRGEYTHKGCRFATKHKSQKGTHRIQSNQLTNNYGKIRCSTIQTHDNTRIRANLFIFWRGNRSVLR
jgi:hypothetical protein